MTEGQFLTSAHFAVGTFMRVAGAYFGLRGIPPRLMAEDKPPLVKWFNDRSIREADNMSDEVLRAFWRKVQE